MSKPLRVAALAGATIVGCLAIAQAFGQNVITESLSVTAYQGVVPRLAELKPGDRLQSKFKWRVFEGKTRPIAVADGWVGPFSGGFPSGSEHGFGTLIGQTGDLVTGEHVFGHLVGQTRLLPQYVVTTQATVISREEYERLRGEKAGNIGYVIARGERGATTVNFKDAVVKETRRLAFSATSMDGRGQTVHELLRWHATAERFRAAGGKLESLSPGTAYWDAMATLEMSFWTTDAGVSYRAWMADGYVGGGQSMLTEAGYFQVFPFGYLEGDNEVRKLALIFKNNRVHKVVPHGTPNELMRHFN